MSDYSEYTITNIRRGKDARAHIVYAVIRDDSGEIVVSATLEYCTKWIQRQITEMPETGKL